MSRRPKRTSAIIKEFRGIITDVWSRFIYKREPIYTKEFFKLLNMNYNDVYERNLVYKEIIKLRDEADKVWRKFYIEDGDKEKIYDKFMEYCYEKKKPLIIMFDSLTLTPKTYAEWNRILSRNCHKEAYSFLKSIERLSDKNMDIIFKIGNDEFIASIKELGRRHDETLKLLENLAEEIEDDEIEDEEDYDKEDYDEEEF